MVTATVMVNQDIFINTSAALAAAVCLLSTLHQTLPLKLCGSFAKLLLKTLLLPLPLRVRPVAFHGSEKTELPAVRPRLSLFPSLSNINDLAR